MGSLSSRVPSSPSQIMAATQFVKDAIAHDSVVIFSKSDCGYCQMAKEVYLNYLFILCCFTVIHLSFILLVF